jgi:hypothetical protein
MPKAEDGLYPQMQNNIFFMVANARDFRWALRKRIHTSRKFQHTLYAIIQRESLNFSNRR